MIYNKSGHPIEIKKISIRLWTLRDEIEAAIERRMKECEAAGVPLYIDDIKKFYNLDKNADLDNVVSIDQGQSKDMNSIMESIGEEVKTESDTESRPPTEGLEGQASEDAPATSLTNAEEIIAEQVTQGLETTKPNPVVDRPYERQAPDLDKISYGFTLLSDINMENILGFVKNNFLQGQSVVVEFLIPQSFKMSAHVSYCHHYAMRSKIISSTKPDYRLQCQFTYLFSGERDRLRKFLKSIEPNISSEKKKAKANDEDSMDL